MRRRCPDQVAVMVEWLAQSYSGKADSIKQGFSVEPFR